MVGISGEIEECDGQQPKVRRVKLLFCTEYKEKCDMDSARRNSLSIPNSKGKRNVAGMECHNSRAVKQRKQVPGSTYAKRAEQSFRFVDAVDAGRRPIQHHPKIDHPGSLYNFQHNL